MPKLKTKSSVKKRFSFTGSGKIKRNWAGKLHFMRRRSKIDLVVHDDDIAESAGLAEVAEILFGAEAERRLAEYFGGADRIPAAVRAGLGRAGTD